MRYNIPTDLVDNINVKHIISEKTPQYWIVSWSTDPETWHPSGSRTEAFLDLQKQGAAQQYRTQKKERVPGLVKQAVGAVKALRKVRDSDPGEESSAASDVARDRAKAYATQRKFPSSVQRLGALEPTTMTSQVEVLPHGDAWRSTVTISVRRRFSDPQSANTWAHGVVELLSSAVPGNGAGAASA